MIFYSIPPKIIIKRAKSMEILLIFPDPISEAVLISIEKFAMYILVHPYGMPVRGLSFVLPNAHAYGM